MTHRHDTNHGSKSLSLSLYTPSVSRVSCAGHTARADIELAGAHIQCRCLVEHEAAYCALQPVVFAQSWKTRPNRAVFRTSTYCGTPRDTAEYFCLASDVRQWQVFFLDWGNLGVERKCELLRNAKDAWVQFVWFAVRSFGSGGVHVARTLLRLWLYLDCIIGNVPGRSIPLLLLDANGHTGLKMVQPKVWRHVSSDAIGHRFPQRENFNGGQFRFLLGKHFMTAINTDERFCCGPTYFGPPPLCARTRVDSICVPHATQLQVRDVTVFRSWGSRLHSRSLCFHLPVGAAITIFCLWCQLVFSILTQRYGTYRNDWKLEPAVQKIRGVNMMQSLRRPW